MKIIIVSIYPVKGERHGETGGVASYTKNLVSCFPQKKDDVIFVLCDKNRGKIDSYRENGVNVVRCFDKNVFFFFQILREIRKIRPDIIHIQQELGLFGNIVTAYLLQWLLFSLKKYKTIITLHGVVSLKKITKDFVKENSSQLPVLLVRLAFFIIYKPICILSKRVIVHEDIFRDILVNEYKIDSRKVSVIPHGVEDLVSIPRDVACKNLSLDQSRDIILFMGYLTGYKGIDFLIDEFSEYTKINPSAFLIIGSGKHPKLKNDLGYQKEYTRLFEKAKSLIPNSQYRWDGFIKEENIQKYFSAADVSIYPYTISMSSSGPMAIAIGYGKPFFASDVFKGVLDEDFLFPREKGGAMRKIIDFFENRTTHRNKIFKLKKNRIWSVVSKKTYEIYRETYEGF